MRTKLACAGVLVCALPVGALTACSSSDDRPPSPGGSTIDFDPIVGNDGDAATAGDGGTPDAARDASTTADADLPDLPEAPPHVDPATERLVVSDATAQKLYVVNARDFSVVAELEASAGSHITAGPSGRYAYVYSTAGDGVRIVDVGLSVVRDTGMPARPALSTPSVLASRVSGAGPRSVLTDGTSVSVSFGLEPRAAFFEETSLPSALDPSVVTTGFVHDGVALTVGALRLTSRRDDDTRPGWLLAAADSGVSASVSACEDPYLAGNAGSVGAVVCSAGVALLSTDKSGALKSTFVSYTSEAALSAHDLVGRPGTSEFAFIDGAASVVHVDESGATATTLAADVAAIAYPPRGKQLWVLLKNGQLSLLDAATLALTGDSTDTGCESSGDGPLPALRFGASSAYLTCPARGEVRELDAGSGLVGAVHTLGQAPFDLASFTF